MEDRLAELEQQFAKHGVAIHERLGRFESSVDDRLLRVEELLEKLVSKLGSV